MSRPRLAAIAALLVVTCALAALLVLGSSDSTQSVSASSAAQVSQAKPITGKLSKPGYTVIAVAADGIANTDLSATDGSFRVSPTAETVSLHLRAPEGSYAGPITIAESEAAIAQRELKVTRSKTKVKDSEAKVRRAKKQVKRTTKKVKKAKRKLRKASGKQAKKKARKKLKQAKRKLRQAKKKLRLAKKKLSKAKAQLRAARSELQAARERQTGERAILGVRSASALGSIQVDSAAGFAKAEASTVGQWESWVDTKRWAQASSGVPIGAGNFGRVSSSQLSGSGVGDLDRDGVSDPLDIDDDGDLVLDNLDSFPSGSGPRASGQLKTLSGGFITGPWLALGQGEASNANAGMSKEQIEALFRENGDFWLTTPLGVDPNLENFGLQPGEYSELDCGEPQGSADPGLTYCTEGGTGKVHQRGTAAVAGVDTSSWPEFPGCCDFDGDGFGTVIPPPPGSILNELGGNFVRILHGANFDQIASGDVLIQRARALCEEESVCQGPSWAPDGTPAGELGPEIELVGTQGYVFATTPTLVSYDDGQGNSATPSYPTPPQGPGSDKDPFPVRAGPSGDVVVEFTFWRPQRLPIEPETGDWYDVGGLGYLAFRESVLFGLGCPQSAYSSSDPNLVPGQASPLAAFDEPTAALVDQTEDQPASPGNTLTYELNLTECFEATPSGDPPELFDVGDTGRVVFMAATPEAETGDQAWTQLNFRHVP